MPIENGTDRNGKFTLIKGVITGLWFNEIAKDKIRTYDQGWTPTHRINLIVDNIPIGMGLCEDDEKWGLQIRGKDANGVFHTLNKGIVVEVDIEEVSEYNNKPQYNSKAKNVKVIDVSGAQVPASIPTTGPSEGGGNANITPGQLQEIAQAVYKMTKADRPAKSNDNLAIQLGNAVNVASNLSPKKASGVEIIKLASDTIYPKTTKLKEKLVAAYPEMNNYELGARMGQALLLASDRNSTVDKVFEAAERWFKGLCKLEAGVRDSQDALVAAKAQAEADLRAEREAAEEAERAAQAEEEAKTLQESTAQAAAEDEGADCTPAQGFDDFDDDLPF